MGTLQPATARDLLKADPKEKEGLQGVFPCSSDRLLGLLANSVGNSDHLRECSVLTGGCFPQTSRCKDSQNCPMPFGRTGVSFK